MTETLWEGIGRHPRPQDERGALHTARHYISAQTFPAPPKDDSPQTPGGNVLWPPRAPGEKDLSSGTLGNGMWESPSGSLLEKGLGDVTITTNSLNKQINSEQSSARLA